mmetsp:Transcript_37569/g.91153  ORF Transcript_37569/g.91153 Transcript_37569/m.91153 type:complete len:301 (+) Transcript_37569:188-1090(+)
MDVESSHDDKRNPQPKRQKRRILRMLCVVGSLLAAYVAKEIAFSAHLSSTDSPRSRNKGSVKESMLILHWKNPEVGSRKQHLDFVNVEAEIKTQNQRKYAPIDTIHKFGHLHTGAWMVVLDTNAAMQDAKILMLKRSPHVVTCPNYWSFLGEHSNRDEKPKDFVIRGMREELGERFYHQFVQTGGEIKPLVDHPIFFKRDYDTPRGKRMDRQINYIFTIEMNTPATVLEKLSIVDKEAAEVAWVTKHEIKRWLTETPNERFCHNATTAVMDLVMEQLESLEMGVNSNMNDMNDMVQQNVS